MKNGANNDMKKKCCRNQSQYIKYLKYFCILYRNTWELLINKILLTPEIKHLKINLKKILMTCIYIVIIEKLVGKIKDLNLK